MKNGETLTGQTIGFWKVGQELRKNNRIYYTCTCQCGTVKDIVRFSLLRGDTLSCGCRKPLPQRVTQNIGKQIGNLTIVDYVRNYNNSNKSYYKCQCICGNYIYSSLENLKNRKNPTCGCIPLESSKRIDRVGERFGRLIVLEMLYHYNGGKRTWARCQCDCGNETLVDVGSIVQGLTKSCGCYESESRYQRQHYKDITNMRFGMLTAISITDQVASNGSRIWHCKCDCGKYRDVSAGRLLRGDVKSCGCDNSESIAKDLTGLHFEHLTPLYPIKGKGKGVGSIKRMWMCQCDCGNQVKVSTNQLLNYKTTSCGCVVKASRCETLIKNFLKEHEIQYIPQYKFDDCKNKRKLPFDFYLLEYNTLIEYDGGQHYFPVERFGGEASFEQRKANDEIKTRYCQSHNINLIRLPYTLSDKEIKEQLLNIINPVTTTVA